MTWAFVPIYFWFATSPGGVRTLDSLQHVACALELKAERFWTFDDRQLKGPNRGPKNDLISQIDCTS
jgi:hypothetical protein